MEILENIKDSVCSHLTHIFEEKKTWLQCKAKWEKQCKRGRRRSVKYYKESAHPGKGGVAGMAVPCRGKKKSPGGHVSTSNELKTLSCAGNTKLKIRPCLQRVLFL